MSEEDLEMAIVRGKHLGDFPHRIKIETFEFPNGVPQHNRISMNCGRKSCWLPSINPEYFTLNEV